MDLSLSESTVIYTVQLSTLESQTPQLEEVFKEEFLELYKIYSKRAFSSWPSYWSSWAWPPPEAGVVFASEAAAEAEEAEAQAEAAVEVSADSLAEVLEEAVGSVEAVAEEDSEESLEAVPEAVPEVEAEEAAPVAEDGNGGYQDEEVPSVSSLHFER
ncbi:unnamed protein product [Cyprideis torosa]|uniref:Uncharacterized protein n=1 Tax=Cyprideis torosa TaxID=163714 RepID=A0A7R8ZN16_9CRUS|nr:unnamed protein product [Cyprideis torosa]CAG0885602.1 unnamed protein product [Cyprideis torosa]